MLNIHIIIYNSVLLGLKLILVETYLLWPAKKYPSFNAIFFIKLIWSKVNSTGRIIKYLKKISKIDNKF